jgi:uncharacterized Fe-S cluster-containing radical SAM superfamily enzyme|tara:strand:+ start:35 stop:244 length:210 start_codon:yes stop_codon:yes gene_type:complete
MKEDISPWWVLKGYKVGSLVKVKTYKDGWKKGEVIGGWGTWESPIVELECGQRHVIEWIQDIKLRDGYN